MILEDMVHDEPLISDEDYVHAQDHLKGVVDQIYSQGNIEDLEWHLEEVLRIFEMRLPSQSPILQKKPNQEEESQDRMLKAWVGYTRAYAEMMTT